MHWRLSPDPFTAFGSHPHDAPWAREIELHDPDRNWLRIGIPQPEGH